MKVIYALTLLLFSLTLCQSQYRNSAQGPDEAYTRELVRLLTGLQKNPWLGWESGTEVVIRYLVDSNASGIPLGHPQPDLVYKVIETDKLFIQTYVFKGKPGRRNFLVKDQVGLEAAWSRVGEQSAADLEIDGFTLTCHLSELTMTEIPGGTRVTKEWVLASHPSVVLGKEVKGGSGWRVTSARVIKKIGEKEFPCVEIKKWLSIYSHGQIDVITTQYLSPNVPGHLVEQIEEYFKVKKKQRSSAPYMVVHQKAVELKLQKRATNNGRRASL
jgi:hypothetical protein